MQKIILFTALAVIILAGCIFFVLQNYNLDLAYEPIGLESDLSAPAPESQTPVLAESESIKTPQFSSVDQELNNAPEIVKAVYVTGASAGSSRYLAYLENLFKNTQINAVVVDIKGSDGYVSYVTQQCSDVKNYGLYGGQIKDISILLKFFHDRNIYVIGRISVFQDPIYAKAKPELAIYSQSESLEKKLWQDSGGMFWLDPASQEVRDYNICLAKDAFSRGFDEINFDYVRFPSDGDIKSANFPIWDGITPAANVIKSFFEYTRAELVGGKISVDLFGQTTTDMGDMGIGQILENAFENFDYISPMIYPSHYAEGFLGFTNPAEHPYEIIKYSMLNALIREKIWVVSVPAGTSASQAKFRPWLQDFDMGADYNEVMIKSEIMAVQEALGDEYRGFMLWNPSNIYTAEAVKKE